MNVSLLLDKFEQVLILGFLFHVKSFVLCAQELFERAFKHSTHLVGLDLKLEPAPASNVQIKMHQATVV